MPNIQQYDSPALSIRPSETGVESVAGAARRIGGFANQEANETRQLGRDVSQLGDEKAAAMRSVGRGLGSGIEAAGDAYVNYLDHREISAGSAHGTQLMAALTDQWNKTISDPNIDPNDPSIAKKFLEENLEPALDQFKEGFTTEKSQQFAEQFTDRFRQHMFTKTSADMSTLAGIALKTNVQTTVNSLSTMVNSDPSSLPAALATADHTIGSKVDTSPTLDPTTKASVRSEVGLKAKQDIVKSAALGMLQQNPDADLSALDKKYPGLINASEMNMFQKYAQAQKRAANADIEMQRRRAKEVAQDQSTAASNQYLIDIRSQDPRLANDPTAKKVLNDPTLTKTDKNNLLNYIDRQTKPETDARTSQQTFVGLLRDLRQPNADTDAIMQKAWDARLADPGKPGSMTERDFDQFRNEVVARKTPEGAALQADRANFFKNYGQAIAGQTYTPATGDPKVYNAEMDARRMEGYLKSKGIDPHEAYDPASQYFLGKPERIAKWAQSMQVDLQDRAAQPAAASVPAPKPEVPFALRGIADLSRNKKTGQYRDNLTGKIYDAAGKELSK